MAKIKEFISDSDLSVDNKSKGEDVSRLQKMLERFGYLQPGSYEDATYDNKTERAVRKYQRFMGLTSDGVAGPKTKGELLKPRCIHPDSSSGSAAGAYTLSSKYNSKHLTYAFENNPADLDANVAKAEIRAQFAKWQAATQLTFTEVTVTQNPTFRIAWKRGDHQDGHAFDGAGNVLAHAFYPPPNGGAHAGQMHFDEDETFSLDGAGNTIKLGAVTLHEIGHLIGLNHSNVPDAVMWPSYDSNKTELHEDDINGAADLYGLAGWVLTGTLSNSLSAPGASQTWKLDNVAAADMEVFLDADNTVDFDLYVKFNGTATADDYDYKSWNVGDERLIIFNHPAGYASFLVQSYEGSGPYTLEVRFTPAS